LYEALRNTRKGGKTVSKHSLCEVFVKRLLPALRALLAKELIEGHGLTQLEVSRILGVSQPLINYYLTGRRKVPYANALSRCPKVVSVVKSVARMLVTEGIKGKGEVNVACLLCTALRASEALKEALRACGVREDEVVYPVCGELNAVSA